MIRLEECCKGNSMSALAELDAEDYIAPIFPQHGA